MIAMSFHAVIFDLDGTLVDSAGEIARALNRLLATHDRAPLARREVEALIGKGVRVLVERALRMARVTGASLDLAVETFERFYAEEVGTEARLYPGAREALLELELAGIPMAVVTNKPRFFTEQLLGRLDVLTFFRTVVAGDDGIPRKPAGDMLLAAARDMGVDIDSVLMLGDSENDVLAARDAGCVVWCVPYGYNEGRAPASLEADRIVPGLQEAAQLLLDRREQALSRS